MRYKSSEGQQRSEGGNLFIKGEPNFICVILIRSLARMPCDLRKTCELLRLSKINNLVIVKNNRAVKRMLEKIKTYVAYGTVSLEVLRELMYKKAMCTTDINRHSEASGVKFQKDIAELERKKTKHTRKIKKYANVTNFSIWNHFQGKYSCIEELIEIIWYGKEDFKQVMKFLTVFHMEPPIKGYSKKKKVLNISEGGASGDWMESLDELVRKMIR